MRGTLLFLFFTAPHSDGVNTTQFFFLIGTARVHSLYTSVCYTPTQMSVEALIEAIHASPVRLSLCICGAGSGAVARLAQVPECSRTLLEADVLYHRASARFALDGLPKHLVSVEAARRLAQHAFHVSRTLVIAETREKAPSKEKVARGNFLFGIGATSAVKTSRARHSCDQVFVSVWGGHVHAQEFNPIILDPDTIAEMGDVYDYHMSLSDNLDRAGQDKQVELMVLHAIADTVARCVSPTDTQLVSCRSSGRVYPTALFRTLLPASTQPAPSPPSTSSPAAVTEKVEQLCAVPTRSGPHHVSLDTAHEVAEAIQAVLSYEPAPGASEDICVLWNRHGELRRSNVVPYDVEYYAADAIRPEEAAPSSADAASDLSTSSAETPHPLRLLYPGSFNPLHYGHTELALAALRVLRQQPAYRHDPHIPVEVTYEIAVKVVDKGAISREDLHRRVAQFLERGERVAVTNAKLFISKAKLFPGHGFLIGIDTAVRVLDPRHYSTSTDPREAEAAMEEALQRDIGDRGCYFVVGGRKVSGPVGWQDLSMLTIPAAIRHLFIGIPAEDFRVDISSTELRAKKRTQLHPHAEAQSNM